MHAHDADVVVVVLAAVIERDGRFLVTRRQKGTHLDGLWEFPGGKCEPGETHAQCLARELREELGLEAVVGDELLVTEHAYPERTVRLHFRRCTIAGEPARGSVRRCGGSSRRMLTRWSFRRRIGS